ncbi:MAG: hypothetical protein LUQ50_13245 [Methanospirillum sp.]|uniref:hypothetical protein n=1 Tax=Methanospirillum sp. TaxID=45200 RepID=UPI002371930D|nr:hypothetical protein [Methanospirillum sp.]MDD1730020.1 hypothetical protein [Methanospirillum sp.]
MITKNVLISLMVALFLVSLVGNSYAEEETVNVTNISQSGNVSVNETNQSDLNLTSNTPSHVADSPLPNGTATVASEGGIKNFMKNFKYQSGV